MAKTRGKEVQKDLYGILEVSPRARKEVLHAAYISLMKIHNPANPAQEQRAREIIEAYKTLSDPAKREDYDSSQINLGGKIIGGLYRVQELIAEGGYGRTYKGEQILVGMPVCVKHCSQVSPQDETILIEEAQAVWDLRHYALPTMRDFIKLEDGSVALIMSYIPGPTLEQIVKKKGRMDPENVAWIAERILNALMYLHHHGVVHGDIKPQNIIIQPDTHTVCLVDFGLSMIRPKKDTDNKGYTPLFSPPEQEEGRVLLPQSDFFSLGMTMIYALSGGLEFVGKKQIPQETPIALCNFVKKLIVRDVLGRPSWEDTNLFESIQEVRVKSFGRSNSHMKSVL